MSKGLVQDCLPQSSRKEKLQRHLRFQRKTSVRKRWNSSQLLARVICINMNVQHTIFTNFIFINKNNFTHQRENNHCNCLEAENLHTSYPWPLCHSHNTATGHVQPSRIQDVALLRFQNTNVCQQHSLKGILENKPCCLSRSHLCRQLGSEL